MILLYYKSSLPRSVGMVNNTWQTKHENRSDDEKAVTEGEADQEMTDGAGNY